MSIIGIGIEKENQTTKGNYMPEPRIGSEGLRHNTDWDAFWDILGAALSGPAGCATLSMPDLPDWTKNPPQDHYAGVSDCYPNQKLAEMKAFVDALKKKCGVTSYRLELTNYYPRFQKADYYTCNNGDTMVCGLFRSKDLDCSLLKPY